MTIEQAIEILSDFSKQVSAKADGAYERNEFTEAKKLAIEALKEQQERSGGCLYCQTGKRMSELPTVSPGDVRIKPSGNQYYLEISFDDYWYNNSYEEISFCPRCGKRLEKTNA